jgi:outer membrane protein OmpA-like peptidoglycan-associated protein
MAFNILDAVKGFITPDIIARAASYLRESDSSVSRAVSGLVPAALAGITQRAESGGADTVFQLAQAARNSGILDQMGNVFSSTGGGIPESAPQWLNGIFGDKVGAIANSIAQFAGIKGSSAASLLGSIVPMALGLLGRHAADTGMSASGLASFLSSQKSSFLNAIPGGLNLSGILGPTPATVHEEPKKPKSWLMPLILGIAAIALLLYLSKGCNSNQREESKTEAPAGVAPDSIKTDVEPKTTVEPARERLMLKLADGTEVDVYQGGFESGLVNCLNDASCKAGKDKWFDFDDINFETGSAKLTDSSMRQVKNLVIILKAYPKAKIKIGGYTDRTGDAQTNKKLSADRAEAVLVALKSNGAQASQLLGSEGYGSEFAKQPKEASDEERKSDRRISVQLRDK